MRAFVAGATGYTGRDVVRLLTERRIPTVAHIRPDSPRLERWNDRFGILGADVDTTPWDEDAMTATLTRLAPTLIFALLGTTRAQARAAAREGRSADYEAIDYGLTALLIRAAAASGHRPRVVYLSAMGVGPKTRNAYLDVRWRIESMLRDQPIPFTVARPAIISGPDRDEARPMERVGAVAGDAILGVLGKLGARKLADRYRSITSQDLAAALIRAGLDPAHANATLTADDLRGGPAALDALLGTLDLDLSAS